MNRVFYKAYKAIFTGLLRFFVVVALTNSCIGQSEVVVKCVDEKNKPIEDVEVYLFQFDGESYKQFGPFVSNMAGEVTCGTPLFAEGTNFDRWVYARVKGKLVGLARSAKFKNGSVSNPESKIVLRSSRSLKGKVDFPDGIDPGSVTVRVNTLWIRSGSEMFDYESLPRHYRFPGLDTGLKEIFDYTPKADGTFEIHDLPQVGRVFLTTVAKGCGQAQWSSEEWTMKPSAVLKIEPEIPIRGTLKMPDGKPAIGRKIHAILEHGKPFNPSHMASFFAKTNEQGHFAISGMPHAHFTVQVEDDDDNTVFMPKPKLIGKPKTGLKLDLNLEEAVTIMGRVTDIEGIPVAAASISAVHPELQVGFDHTSTDKDGNYQLRVPATQVGLYFNGLPEDFKYPDPQIFKTLDIKRGQKKIDNDIFKLDRR